MDGLTHYTGSIRAVVGILNNGFAFVPNRRELMPALVPNRDFSRREPQEFGMISFTDLIPPAPVRHRGNFGNFGIIVSREWACAKKKVRGFAPENIEASLRAQRVIYIEEGPVLDVLEWLFTKAYDELENNIEHPGDAFAQMAFTSKPVAAMEGGLLIANLMTLYEYLAKGENAYQSEWRIVNPLPVYGYARSTPEIIKAISPPEAWAKVTGIKTLEVPEEAVAGFVCPCQDEEQFRQALPANFAAKPITLYKG